MDKNNGTISVASELDFESKASYSITLEAKDGGNKITEVSVNIMIIDDNDNQPIFVPSGTTMATLEENEKDDFFVAVKVNSFRVFQDADVREFDDQFLFLKIVHVKISFPALEKNFRLLNQSLADKS